MKYNRNPLSQAIQNTLGAGAVLSMALASGVAFAQDEADDEEGVELDRVQVTGSRIKRVDIEGSTPITVISREEIDFSGDSTVAELLRGSTFNSFGSFRDRSGFGLGFSGTSFVSLRGLGSQCRVLQAHSLPDQGSPCFHAAIQQFNWTQIDPGDLPLGLHEEGHVRVLEGTHLPATLLLCPFAVVEGPEANCSLPTIQCSTKAPGSGGF